MYPKSALGGYLRLPLQLGLGLCDDLITFLYGCSRHDNLVNQVFSLMRDIIHHLMLQNSHVSLLIKCEEGRGRVLSIFSPIDLELMIASPGSRKQKQVCTDVNYEKYS